MLIHFERTGGFAGLRTAVTLNTDTLPQDEARKLQEMADAAGFFNLPEKFPLPKRGADYFVYRLTVEKDGRKHTVEVSEPAVPAELRPLLQYLMKHTG
jgi:hypothetical protein